MAYKRNHYVPQFYLKSFALPIPGHRKPKIWVYDKEGGPSRQQSPKDTAVMSDIYTIRNIEGSIIEINIFVIAEGRFIKGAI